MLLSLTSVYHSVRHVSDHKSVLYKIPDLESGKNRLNSIFRPLYRNDLNKLCGAICWVILYIRLILGLTIYDDTTSYMPIAMIAYNFAYEILFSIVHAPPSRISFAFYSIYVGLDFVYFVIASYKQNCTLYAILCFLIFFKLQAVLIERCHWDPRSVRYLTLFVFIFMDSTAFLYGPTNSTIIAWKAVADGFYALYCFFKNKDTHGVYAAASIIWFLANIFCAYNDSTRNDAFYYY
eukprot:340345_1